ncbi:MAG: flagellar biosynthesis protein FliQ [Clostridia bacterium]|nr:flagellar biosynthesis protein FliQ [Clostridia bacterium]
MEQAQIINVLQQAVYTILISSMPLIGVGLAIGLIVSIFQAATQINEQTLTFAPKIIGILLALLVFAGFIFTKVNEFTQSMFSMINTIIR